MPLLVCIAGMNKGELRKLPKQGVLNIGRGEKSDLCVYDRKSSRNHCRICTDGEAIFLEDLNSTNGVQVNGERISGKCKLRFGDQLAIGQTVFQLAEDATAGAEQSDGNSKDMKIRQRKCENLLKKTSFPTTKTTSLDKVKPSSVNGGRTDSNLRINN